MRRSIAIITALGLSFTAAAPAAAQFSTAVNHTVRVTYQESELQTEAGIQAIYTRVENAARGVCREIMLSRPINGHATLSRCSTEVLADAIEGARIPALTEYYAAVQTGPAVEQEIASR